MMIYLLLIAVSLWLIFSFKTVKENEVAIVTRFSEPRRVVESGLRFVPFMISDLVRYSTNIQEYEFPAVGVLTAQKDGHSSVKMTGDLSVRFVFPADQSLVTSTVKSFPRDEEVIESLLKEAALDIVEGVAFEYHWVDLYHNTKKFNGDIKDVIEELYIDDPENVIVQAGLQKVKIMFINPSLPEELEQAIHKPEAATLTGEAERIKKVKESEGQKEADQNKADAEEYRVNKVYRAILGKQAGENISDEDGKAIRQLEAFEQAAQGESNMILSVPELAEFAKHATGATKRIITNLKK